MAPWVPKAQRVSVDLKAQRAPPASMVMWGQEGLRESKVFKVFRGRLVLKESRASKAFKENRASKVKSALKASADLKA